MAEKGIIIDVGFAPQWKDFLNEIDKELSKIDFDKYINLDDAFDKQAKEIRQKLKDLKKEINSIMNGNNSDPVKAFNELNKSVKSLSGVVLNMAKAMPDGTEYTREINSITNSIEELSDQAQNAVNTVESLSEVSVEKLNFKPQLDQLKELWGELDKVYKALDNPRAKNKSNGIPYSEEDSEELISKIRAEYNVYLEISEQIGNIQYDTTLSAEEMDEKLNRAYISIGKTISKLNNLVLSSEKIGIDSSLEIDTGINIDSVKLDIDEQTNEIVDYINTAKARIQNEFTQLGGNEDLESWFTKRGKASGGIKIPISLDSNSRKKLYNQTIDVIHKVQSELNEPILVEVQLVSAYQSRGNQTILSQIQEELNNIKDGEITQKLQSLIDKMNKRVENAFMLNIHLNTQNATNQLRHFIKNIKDEIRDVQRLLTINPEFEITPEIRQKLIDEIEEVKSLYKLTIDVGFDFDSEELQNEIVKLDSLYEKIDELKNTNILELDETNSKNIESQITVIQKAIEKLIQTGNQGDKTISLLKTLQSSLKELSSNKSINQINKFSDALNNLKKSFQNLNRVKDVALLSSIQEILNKGEELKTFAEILKSTKKEIQNAEKALSKQDKLLEGNLNLENYSDIIKQRALNNIPDIDFKLMSQSLEATSEGLVKVTSLIKTADGEYVKYIHTATDGEEIQQQKIESGTASILKQAKAIERLNAKAEENKELKKIGEVAPGTEKWEELIVLIESFGIKLKDVKQIIQTIDEEGYESFQVYHGDGLRTTLGMNSKDILYAKNNIADLTDTTDKFQSILKKLPSEFKKAFKDNGLSTGVFIDDIQELLELYQKLYSLSASGMNIDFGNVQEQVNDLRTSITNVFKYDPSLVTEGFEIQFNSIRDDFLKLFNNITQGASMSESEIKQLVASLAEVGKQFEDLKDKSNVLTNKKSIANALKTVQTELFQNSAMDKQFKKVLTSYRDELQNALDLYNKGMEKEAGLTKERLSEIVSGIMEIQGKIQASEKTGLSTINKIGKAIKTNFVQYVARYLSIQDIIRYLSSMTREVKNIDTALTELRKVSDATTERLQVSLKKSAETAKELGNSIDYVINITSDWARLGFNVDEAEELARVTTLFKNVGDNMSAEDASSFMISTLQGFQMTAEESESIVDKFNEVANNYAIDTAGIGEALQRSAASFNAANTSLSGAIAVVTTANSVVQNPEQVGTAMKTLSARIRGSKAELEELGEEEENIVNLTSKLRAEVKAMTGFDIMADEETYKSIDEIIIGIGEHWQELTDIQQAALAEDLAGKRNSNVLIALLQNAEQVKKVYETAEGSAGSAMREQENYAKSIEYSIYRVKAIWQDLITKVLKSENIKKLVDTAGDSLEKIGNSLENFVPLLTLIMNLLSGVIDLLGKAAKIGNGIPLLAGIGIAGYKIKNSDSDKEDIFKKLRLKISSELIKSKEKEIATITANTIANEKEIKSEIADAAAKKANKEATDKETVSVWKLVAAKIAEAKATLIAGGPAMWAALAASIALVAVAIATVAKKYYDWYHSAEQVIKRSEKLREELKKTSDELKEQAKSAQDAEKNLRELADSYKEAVVGSEEFYELSNKIAELEPSLVVGYTSNGDAIIADTNAIYDQIDAYKQLREEKIAEAKASARDLINTNIQVYDNTLDNKNNIDEEIAKKETQIYEQEKRVEKLKADLEQQYGENWQLSEGAVDFGQEYDVAIKNLEQYRAELKSLQEESKQYGQYLKQLDSEFGNTYQYLFDDFDETLSDKDKEFEKNIRQFVLGVAKEAKLSPEDFDKLYDSAKGVNKELFKQLFELDASELSYEEYYKQANNIYEKIINALEQDSDFELTDDHRLGIKVVLGIDNTSLKNQKNQRNKFVKSIGIQKGKGQAKDWYDQRTADEIKLINENIDKFKSLKYIDAEHLVENLDEVLKQLKQINKEVDDLEFSMSSFEEKENEVENLQSLYNQFVSNIEGDSVTVPLDISDIEGLREKWQDIVGKEDFDKFELIVTTEGFKDSYQEAFDGMLSKYLSVQISMRGATAETAAMMKSQLKIDGLTDESAENFVNAKMAEAKAYDFTAKAKQTDNALTKETINTYIAECEQLGITTDLMGDYLTEAMLIDGVTLSINGEEELEELASKLNIDINLLKELRGLLDPINSGNWNGAFAGVPSDLRDDLLKRQQDKIKNKNDEKYEKGIFDLEKAKQDAKDAGKEVADEYVEAFEKELKELDDLRDSGVLGEKDYLNRLQALYIKYFANRKEYIKEFKKYEKQYLEGMQALYEKAISAAITLLNDQKDELEKAKDDALEGLEDAKDAEIDPIKDHIKALEDEKDSLEKEREAMQKANDERERQINLQKAQYELERANSQRTRLIYKNGQMQYVQDYQEVRNAKKNLEDAIFEKNIAKLDNQIDNIDNQIENLNKQLDDIEEKYDKLIEDTEKFYDAQIKGVQDLIDMWEKLQHQADLVEAYEALNNFGISAQDILSGNLNVFNQIRDGYIGTFAGLSSDANAVAQAFGTTTDNALALKDAILGYDDATASFAQLANNIANVGTSANDAANKVGGTTSEGNTTSGGLNGNLAELSSKKEDVQELANTINGNDNSLTNAMNEFGNTSETVVSKVSSLFGSLAGVIADTSNRLADIINKSKEKLDLATPNKVAKGGAGFSGTAYADGNWTAGSKGIVGKSLVGELGAEIRVRNGKFEVLGSNGAEFADIRKNDIIFNHKQSEELLKNGHINSRGKAFASGNANKFTALSPEELSKYNKLDFTKDLAEKLDFGNQKLMNIDKTVSTISNNKTVNNNPVINVNNPTFTCTGVNSEQVVAEIQAAFTGLFSNAYQRSMTTK